MAATSNSPFHEHSTTDLNCGDHGLNGNTAKMYGQKIGLNIDREDEVQSNASHNEGASMIPTATTVSPLDATVLGNEKCKAGATQPKVTGGGTRAPKPLIKESQVPYADLFKNNRRVNDSHKVPNFEKGSGNDQD